jgi:hypothetical protein
MSNLHCDNIFPVQVMANKGNSKLKILGILSVLAVN